MPVRFPVPDVEGVEDIDVLAHRHQVVDRRFVRQIVLADEPQFPGERGRHFELAAVDRVHRHPRGLVHLAQGAAARREPLAAVVGIDVRGIMKLVRQEPAVFFGEAKK